MDDPVHTGFLESAQGDALQIGPESDCVRLDADPATGHPPRRYLGLLKGAEHYVRDAEGSFVVTRRPIPFQIDFPDDYLRSLDPNLQFRVLSTSRQVIHPNVHGGVVCLGGRFRPGTRLRSIVEQFHGIATSRVMALDHPFDRQAAEFFRAHLDTVRAFRNEPLWRRPLAASVRVETIPSVPGLLEPDLQETEAS
jgi:hypothetical protein